MSVFAAHRTVWSWNFHAQVELAQAPRPKGVVHLFLKGRMATLWWRASPWARGGVHPVTNWGAADNPKNVSLTSRIPQQHHRTHLAAMSGETPSEPTHIVLRLINLIWGQNVT